MMVLEATYSVLPKLHHVYQSLKGLLQWKCKFKGPRKEPRTMHFYQVLDVSRVAIPQPALKIKVPSIPANSRQVHQTAVSGLHVESSFLQPTLNKQTSQPILPFWRDFLVPLCPLPDQLGRKWVPLLYMQGWRRIYFSSLNSISLPISTSQSHACLFLRDFGALF